MKAVICGTGSAVPTKVLDNDDLSQIVDTSDEWIRERTGIVRRHIAKEETCVSLAVEAAQKALKQSGVSAEEIDLVIVSTISSNVVLPGVACEVQKKIGAVNAVCYDLSAACTGFVLAYQNAQAYLQTGIYRSALIIGSECLSHLVNWRDRGTCILLETEQGQQFCGLKKVQAFYRQHIQLEAEERHSDAEAILTEQKNGRCLIRKNIRCRWMDRRYSNLLCVRCRE